MTEITHETVLLTVRKGTGFYNFFELVCDCIWEYNETESPELRLLFIEGDLSEDKDFKISLTLGGIQFLISSIDVICKNLLGSDAILARNLSTYFLNASVSEIELYFFGEADTFFDLCKSDFSYIPQISSLLNELKGQ